MMKESLGSSYLFGGNAPFIEDLYETYLDDPQAVTPEWRRYFDQMQQQSAGARDVAHAPVVDSFVRLARIRGAPERQSHAPTEAVASLEKKQVSVLQLINAYRFLGVRHANVDPLKRFDKPIVPELDPAYYGLGESDMSLLFNSGSLVGPDQMPLREIIRAVKETYCGSIGVEYMYITDTQSKRWIQQRFESIRSQPKYDADFKRHVLERLTAAETLEKYLHTRYVGQKRFSLEGSESVIPLLDLALQRAGTKGIQETVIGMAHRGRLNVLVNTLGKMPKDLFSEFEGKQVEQLPMGDVKYHQGFSSDIMTPGGPMHLTLAFNPSHLEIVNPVVEGSVRARQHRRKDRDGTQVLPILLHGDASFIGQGVVMETLNLSQTRGYGTGGTLHIIVNNQIGFTTSDTRDTRSILYCTDVAKMVEAPIFHVNGDDPEAVALVTETALDFRMEFHKDVVIDLVCFRRLGHNEQDEPMVTQPLMYKLIAQHPGTRKIYAEKLEREGVMPGGHADELVASVRAALDAGKGTNPKILYGLKPGLAIDWAPYMGVGWRQAADTSLPMDKLHELAKKLTDIPANFKLH